MNEKEWASIWVTQDMCIWEGKVDVLSVVVTPKTAAETVIYLRDGRDVSSSIKLKIRVSGNTTITVNPAKPLFLENGLFVDIDDDTDGVLVIFSPKREV